MLGENIRLGRIAANLDKKSFAKKVGVKVRTVNDWEKGISWPNSKKLSAICDALGTDPNHLLDYHASDAQMHEMEYNSAITSDLRSLVYHISQSIEKGDL